LINVETKIKRGGYDMKTLPFLDEKDLDSMDIKLPGHRKKLLLAANSLRSSIDPPSMGSVTISSPVPSPVTSHKAATATKQQQQQQASAEDFKLRVGQFNLMNLARPNVNYYTNDRYTLEDVEKKIEWTANQLKKMKCNIVGFEELFHEDILKQAIAQSGLPAGKIVFYPSASPPDVALYTQYKVVESQSISDFPKEALLSFPNSGYLPLKSFSHPILRVVLKLPNGVLITVFVVHLKSKRPVVEPAKRHDHIVSCHSLYTS